MATRIIDLSMVTATDPSPLMNVKITHLSHEMGAQADHETYDVDPKDWPFPGKAFADDFIEMTTHAGTHLDAPWHMGPESEGKPAKTIDEWPLERCFGDGVVVDIRDLEDGYQLKKNELQDRLKENGCTLKPGDIFLAMTGNDKIFGTPEYMDRGGHLGPEALEWVLDQGVTTVGTDSWSFDIPYTHWVRQYMEHGRDPKYLWPNHLLGIKREYAHYEKLANLDQLPPYGFEFYGFPVKFSKASAGYVRAVAFVKE
ncbi:MAG: cyclase family protein [Spirochaetaceae bacterium]|nr:cyclase family protein [Spirochaetaceae bacterium]